MTDDSMRPHDFDGLAPTWTETKSMLIGTIDMTGEFKGAFKAGSSQEASGIALLVVMSGIFLEHFDHQWPRHEDGLEATLWFARAGHFFGRKPLSATQYNLLHALADEAGGWWAKNDLRRLNFVPMQEWLARIENTAGPALGVTG